MICRIRKFRGSVSRVQGGLFYFGGDNFHCWILLLEIYSPLKKVLYGIHLLMTDVSFRYCIGSNVDGPLVSGSLRSFVEKLGARSSAPGGGSAAACIASLVSMLSIP